MMTSVLRLNLTWSKNTLAELRLLDFEKNHHHDYFGQYWNYDYSNDYLWVCKRDAFIQHFSTKNTLLLRILNFEDTQNNQIEYVQICIQLFCAISIKHLMIKINTQKQKNKKKRFNVISLEINWPQKNKKNRNHVPLINCTALCRTLPPYSFWNPHCVEQWMMAGLSSLTWPESVWLDSVAGWGCTPVAHWVINAQHVKTAAHTQGVRLDSKMEHQAMYHHHQQQTSIINGLSPSPAWVICFGGTLGKVPWVACSRSGPPYTHIWLIDVTLCTHKIDS